MATRFYLPQTGAAAVSPTFGAWDSTTGGDRIRCVVTKSSTALTSKVIAENSTSNFNLLGRQYVSDAIQAGDITGTVKGILRALENVATENAMPQILIRVFSNDGSTSRGTLINFDNSALSNEYVTALTNRKFPKGWTGSGVTVTTVTAQANDRIVIEFGSRALVGGEGTSSLNFGDTGATDCTEDETGTAANVGWIEFSADLFAAGDTLFAAACL